MTIYQLIAVVSAGLAVAVGLWDAYRLRREQRYSFIVLVIVAGGPILSLWLYLMVTKLSLKPIASIGLLAAGAALGVYLARRPSTVIEVEPDGQTRLRGTSWLALPAAFAVGGVQLAGAISSFAWIIIALAALEAAVAFGVAAAVTLMYRRATIQAQMAAPASPSEPQPTGG